MVVGVPTWPYWFHPHVTIAAVTGDGDRRETAGGTAGAELAVATESPALA